MGSYRVYAYDAEGVRIKNVDVDGVDGPEFYAHQLLHADAVVRVQVYDAESHNLVLDRSDADGED